MNKLTKEQVEALTAVLGRAPLTRLIDVSPSSTTALSAVWSLQARAETPASVR
jgi:hypothetical protein